MDRLVKAITIELSFRTFSDGDAPALISLWNRVHAKYGGFVVKTEERWRWSILQYGAVSPASVIIVTSAGQILAYGALAANGTVLEFAVDADLNRQKRCAVCKYLVAKLEDAARALPAESLSFVAPASDALVDAILQDMGYVAERGDYFMLGILNPAVLVGAILSHANHQLPSTWNRRILVETPPSSYPVALQSRILIDIENGRARVTDASNTSPDNISWQFKIDFTALTDLIFRRSSLRALLAEHRIEVDTRCAASDAGIFFTALQIQADWYTPPSDAF